jgi:hypothetical protein
MTLKLKGGSECAMSQRVKVGERRLVQAPPVWRPVTASHATGRRGSPQKHNNSTQYHHLQLGWPLLLHSRTRPQFAFISITHCHDAGEKHRLEEKDSREAQGHEKQPHPDKSAIDACPRRYVFKCGRRRRREERNLEAVYAWPAAHTRATRLQLSHAHGRSKRVCG